MLSGLTKRKLITLSYSPDQDFPFYLIDNLCSIFEFPIRCSLQMARMHKPVHYAVVRQAKVIRRPLH